MFSSDLTDRAKMLIDNLRAQRLVFAAAESCTGGLVAAVVTSVPGASDVFDRCYVTYSNTAKAETLGVPVELIREHGAVSAEVAAAMALGALNRADVDLAVSITGIAGPGGGTADKPVGLVYLAVSRRNGKTLVSKCQFVDDGRDAIRNGAALEALSLLADAASST